VSGNYYVWEALFIQGCVWRFLQKASN